MQKYKVLFFSLLLFLCACKRTNIPSGILGTDEMSAVLTEVHVADGSMYNTMQVPDSLYKYGTGKYLKIFKNFHTDSVQFKNSMKYYSDNPDLLLNIYEKITTNLKQKSDSLNKINQKKIDGDNKRRADSLKKLPKTPAVTAQPVQTPPVAATPAQNPAAKKFNNKRYVPVTPKKNAHPIK